MIIAKYCSWRYVKKTGAWVAQDQKRISGPKEDLYIVLGATLYRLSTKLDLLFLTPSPPVGKLKSKNNSLARDVRSVYLDIVSSYFLATRWKLSTNGNLKITVQCCAFFYKNMEAGMAKINFKNVLRLFPGWDFVKNVYILFYFCNSQTNNKIQWNYLVRVHLRSCWAQNAK